MTEDTKNPENKSGPAERIAKSGKELAGQATELHRKVAYAGLSLTSNLRGKGDGLLDSIIDVVESVQVTTLEMIDQSNDDIGNGIDKLARAIDDGLDAVEEEVSETLKESGGPSLGKPLKENANMVASMVEEVQKSVTDLTKPLLDEDDEESIKWGDDDLADW
jgi:hypothetical protein